MDKITANVMFEKAGLRHVAWDFCTADDFEKDPDGISERFSKLCFPVFIKPSNAGSSVGITKCRTVDEIKKAIEIAIPVDSRILAEHGLENIREIEVGVMGDGDAGAVGEVKSACEVYDYDSKYNNPESKTEMPANLPENVRKEVENSAKKAEFPYAQFSASAPISSYADNNGPISPKSVTESVTYESVPSFLHP